MVCVGVQRGQGRVYRPPAVNRYVYVVIPGLVSKHVYTRQAKHVACVLESRVRGGLGNQGPGARLTGLSACLWVQCTK